MLLSNKKNHNVQMQLSDTVRYREAVSRLKRILYERPSTLEFSRSKSPLRERRIFPEPIHNKEEYEKDIPDKTLDENQKSMSSLFDMVKRQDDLIAQLEKENLFLKTELVSTAEASKEIAQQNESFRKRLTETLIQMETSPDISSFEVNEKTEEIISCLKEERERLVDCIRLQEDTILNLRQRESEALDKVKQAVGLAEDSQRLTDKVRESSDQNRKDLQHQLVDTFERIQILEQQLKKAQDKERSHEALLRDQEKNLLKLEEDTRDKDLSIKKRELDYQNQVEDVKRNLKEVQASKERLEKVLQEQRNTSEATFKRLEALLDRRNLEAESFAARRKSHEKQIADLKQENQRLLQAINDLAKEKSSHTDDAKFAKQISNLLPEDTISTKAEIKDIKATIEDHQSSITQLQDEVSAVRQEMTHEIEDLRTNIEELCSTVAKNEEPRSSPSKFDSSMASMPNSSHSEGYGSMREPLSQRGSDYDMEMRDKPDEKSSTIISVPFSPTEETLDKPLEVSDGEKDGDETENDATLSEDRVFDRRAFDMAQIKEEELREDANDDNEYYTNMDNLHDNENVSLKESKSNTEDEKERDESTVIPPDSSQDVKVLQESNYETEKELEESRENEALKSYDEVTIANEGKENIDTEELGTENCDQNQVSEKSPEGIGTSEQVEENNGEDQHKVEETEGDKEDKISKDSQEKDSEAQPLEEVQESLLEQGTDSKETVEPVERLEDEEGMKKDEKPKEPQPEGNDPEQSDSGDNPQEPPEPAQQDEPQEDGKAEEESQSQDDAQEKDTSEPQLPEPTADENGDNGPADNE